MKNVLPTLTAVLVALLLLPWLAYSQEAKAPSYKDGDWWKAKIELKSGSPGQGCIWHYSEYVVKIEKGKPKVYGVDGAKQEEIDCPDVEARILGTGREDRWGLKFPMKVGNDWKSRFRRRRRWLDVEFKIRGWEKVKTPKGEFEAFKITRFYSFYARGRGETREFADTYYYSPKVKAVISLESSRPRRQITVRLVDFNVSN